MLALTWCFRAGGRGGNERSVSIWRHASRWLFKSVAAANGNKMSYDPGIVSLLALAFVIFSKPAVILLLFGVGAAGSPRYKAIIPFAMYLIFTLLLDYLIPYWHDRTIDWAYTKTEILVVILAFTGYCFGVLLRFLANRCVHCRRGHPLWMRDLESEGK
jgi:hypothetical protein